jgi:hypothetical protein
MSDEKYKLFPYSAKKQKTTGKARVLAMLASA